MRRARQAQEEAGLTRRQRRPAALGQPELLAGAAGDGSRRSPTPSPTAGYEVVRAHPYKPDEQHGFIASQREGMEVFARHRSRRAAHRRRGGLAIFASRARRAHHASRADPHRRQLVGHVAGPGRHAQSQRLAHQGGRGVLDALERGLHRRVFHDAAARVARQRASARTTRSTSCRCEKCKVGGEARKLGEALAAAAAARQGDHGRLRRRLHGHVQRHHSRPSAASRPACSRSGSASRRCTTRRRRSATTRPRAVRKWMEERGMKFHTGPNHETDLTDEQILLQCKMYIAAVRIADDFGCDAIGIQYQQGLKDLLPASDLVEGTLNNADRPPVSSRDGKRVLYEGEPLPHFNEVDECAGLDALITYRVHKAHGPAGREHAARPPLGRRRPLGHGRRLRLGLPDQRRRAAGALHRRLGGRRGLPPAGDVFPQRRQHAARHLASRAKSSGRASTSRTTGCKMDIGRAGVVALPREETERRWKARRPSGRSCTPSPTASPATS